MQTSFDLIFLLNHIYFIGNTLSIIIRMSPLWTVNYLHVPVPQANKVNRELSKESFFIRSSRLSDTQQQLDSELDPRLFHPELLYI